MSERSTFCKPPRVLWALTLESSVLLAQTRLMAQQKQADGSQQYRGFLHALVTIPREEGLRAMWKGLLPRLMRIPPGQVRDSHKRWAGCTARPAQAKWLLMRPCTHAG
jgi:hypothetical protein